MVFDSLLPLILGMIVFVGGHFLLSKARVRAALVKRFDEGPYLLGYSIFAIVTFVFACFAFARSPILILWDKAEWSWYLAVLLMPFAAIFLVAGATPRSPTTVRGERVVAGVADATHAPAPDPARGIFQVTRHPILWAIAIWAALHLLATGDAAAALLFGGLLILSLGGMAHLDARRAAAGGEAWRTFSARTSLVPFLAIVQGRARLSLTEIGWGRIILGLVLYALLLFGHEWVIGLDVVPGANREGV